MNNSSSRVQRALVTIRHAIRKLAEYQWFLISGGFLLVILFGIIGFGFAYQSQAQSHSLLDLLYFSIQLFAGSCTSPRAE